MKKIKLLAIGNESKFNLNYYIFEKNQYSFETLSKMFYKILGDSWEIESSNSKRKDKLIEVKKLKDEHSATVRVFSENSRLDIFYGDKKMFIILICPEKIRRKINKELDKITKMPKPPRSLYSKPYD